MISKQILARNRDDVALEAVQRHVEVHWKPARGHGGLRPCLALYRRVNQGSGRTDCLDASAESRRTSPCVYAWRGTPAAPRGKAPVARRVRKRYHGRLCGDEVRTRTPTIIPQTSVTPAPNTVPSERSSGTFRSIESGYRAVPLLYLLSAHTLHRDRG